MIEKPILFNTEMARAVLKGKKTQTRRVIKPQPKLGNHVTIVDGIIFESRSQLGVLHNLNKSSCPYGKTGDQLWVRERFCIGAVACGDYTTPDPEPLYIDQCEGDNDYVYYEQALNAGWGMDDIRWKPSIHMPRVASRIQLEVLTVTAERVNDISEQDAIAEGVISDDGYPCEYGELPCPSCNGYGVHGAVGENLGYIEVDCVECDTYKKRFKILWNSINEKRGFGWDTNPWVWVVKFKRLEEPCENSDR